MSYYLYLVETKKEYTIHLTNALAPLMYEGISSIYEDAKTNASDGEELRLFQNLLRKIPSWNEYLIEQETNRIVKVSPKGEIVEDLIKAVIKSNIMILTNTPPEKKDNLRIKHDITSQKFIHNSYMEVARNIFQNPYLFYHKYNSYELKKNQREATDVIKKSIEHSIRKLLPMNLVLQNYLGNSFETQTDDFDNPIPDSDYNNLRHMLNKDPVNNEETFQLVKKNDSISKSQTNTNINKSAVPNQNQSQPDENGILSIKIDMPKTKKNINCSDNFKTLQELAKQNISPIEDKTNQILLNKTEQAIKESDKRSIILSESVKDSINKSNHKTDHKTEHKTDHKTDHNSKSSESNESAKNEKTKNSQLSQTEAEIQKLSASASIKSSRSVKSSRSSRISRNNDETDEDASVSYFRQFSNKDDVAEVYDNYGHNTVSEANDNMIVQPIQNNTQNNTKKTNKTQIGGRQFDYNKILDDVSSVNFNSILNDVSSVDRSKDTNIGNKKKYFKGNSHI
jgi:hypothetical protein